MHDRLEEVGGHLVRGVGFFERELMMDLNLRLSEPLEKTTTFSPCVLLMICDFLFLDHVSSKAHSLFLYIYIRKTLSPRVVRILYEKTCHQVIGLAYEREGIRITLRIGK